MYNLKLTEIIDNMIDELNRAIFYKNYETNMKAANIKRNVWYGGKMK